MPISDITLYRIQRYHRPLPAATRIGLCLEALTQPDEPGAAREAPLDRDLADFPPATRADLVLVEQRGRPLRVPQ